MIPAKKDALEAKKLQNEVLKLKEEVRQLHSGNSTWGAVSRNIWPIVSGLASVAISIGTVAISYDAYSISKETKTYTAEQDKDKAFAASLQMATDERGGQESRLAGIWALTDHWHDKYTPVVAYTLAAMLTTQPLKDGDLGLTNAQVLRYAAAGVIKKAFQPNDQTDFPQLTRLLYGDSRSKYTGAGTVTRSLQFYSSLEASEKKNGPNKDTVRTVLEAIREAVRYNSQYLQGAVFGQCDLSTIDFHRVHAKYAYFGDAILTGANLCDGDLSEATFDGAIFTFADLENADISNTFGWSAVKDMRGANIHGVKNRPREFIQKAQETGALDLSHDEWIKQIKTMDQVPADNANFGACVHRP